MGIKKQSGILLRSAEITNFRGIKECVVDDLSLVNLFVGINNSRKSTLLDAIYIGCKEPMTSSLHDIIKKRVQRVQMDILAYEIFFGYDETSEAGVELKYNTGNMYRVGFSIAEAAMEITKDKKIGSGQLFSYYKNENGIIFLAAYENRFRSSTQLSTMTLEKNGLNIYNNGAMLFSSIVKRNELTNMLDNMLGKIKINRESEKDLIERMSDIYGDFDYEFIPRQEDYRDKRLALTHDNKRIYSDFHGDGVQRALSILSALELSTDSAIFIEEVEMFQHPRALQKLAKHMVELAKKNRVQLFITTHNYYAFRYFTDLGEHGTFDTAEERNDLFRSYILTNNDGIVDAKLENNPTNVLNVLSND